MSATDTDASTNRDSSPNANHGNSPASSRSSRQLQEFSFRDIVHNLFVIAWPLNKIANQAELSLPDDADATLAYGFIHPKLGLSFAAFAPARTSDLGIYDELALNKTVIMIAHRLSSIRDVDQILCIEDGRVVEKGTHEQLLAQKGLYADMWQAQQLEFVNDVSDAVGDASATTVDTATATAPTTADEQEA